MLSYDKALQQILSEIPPASETILPIDHAIGHVLANDVVSQINVSPFRNSAMDGFAVCCDRLSGCSEDSPVTLTISDTLFAGDGRIIAIGDTPAVKIMTGAPVPDQFDAVVKFEDTTYSESEVTIQTIVSPGDNIRPAGEDISKGEIVFCKGRRLNTLDVGILASIGLARVSILDKPRVLLITTGDEIVDPGEPLRFGQIYDSNLFAVSALIRNFCRSLDIAAVTADKTEKIAAELDRRDIDVIITTGAVSAGEKDFVPFVADMSGWKQVFHKVAIKPGKPVFFARRSEQRLIGLPGNPLSAVVTCALFAIPALKTLASVNPQPSSFQPATLRGPARRTSRTLFWPGRFSTEGKAVHVEYSRKRSSAALSAIKDSDGLIMQPSWDGSSDVPEDIRAATWEDLLR